MGAKITHKVCPRCKKRLSVNRFRLMNKSHRPLGGYYRSYRSLCKKCQDASRLDTPKARENFRRVMKRYAERNPEKIKARQMAIKLAKKKKQCEICGKDKNLEFHHPDYSKPLMVLTVCKRCHTNIHQSNKNH